jgi:hypothetical protein
MNIIQIQDRLKGVSDDALKGYVTNPTGEVPTYLALGEIGRREDVRKEYQAAQADQPQKTVAEEKLAAMPQGIGSLTQGMMPSEPQGISQPPMQSTNPAIAQTGVANLPTQNFEAGGVVGYAKGGGILSGIRDFVMGKKRIPGQSGGVGPNGVPITTTTPVPGTRGLVGVAKDNPVKTTLGGAAGLAYLASGDDPEENAALTETPPITEETTTTVTTAPSETEDKPVPGTTYTAGELPEGIKVDDVREYGQDKMERYKELIGEDESRARMKKRLDTMEKELAGEKDDAAYMAMIKTGLAIAGGQSSDAVTNIAQGGIEGIDSYVEEIKYLREQEGDIFDLDMEIAQAERREELAVAGKGYDSEQAAEARNITAALKVYDAQETAKKENAENATGIEKAKIASTVNSGGIYGYKGTKLLQQAYENDPQMKGYGDAIVRFESAVRRDPNNAEYRQILQSLYADRQRRMQQIQQQLNIGMSTTPGPRTLANFDGYSATEITE